MHEMMFMLFLLCTTSSKENKHVYHMVENLKKKRERSKYLITDLQQK